jgi:CubicO group peptidase (beta-lactamase class C family)
VLLATILLARAVLTAQQSGGYFPGPNGKWEHREPAALGLDSAKLEGAIAFAKEHESKAPRDLRKAHDITFTGEPYSEPLGPHFDRGDMTGVIVRHGYVAAEWGEPRRTDMAFSATKSFLSTVVGLAYDRGLIADVHDRVKPYVPAELFETEHNSKITWDDMLRQTSDWEGTLWGKPDWSDRPPAKEPIAVYMARKHNDPGTSYKYNDVRVNVLALAALQLWRRPLPQVLRESIMEPIGASATWRWLGYENSWVNIDGVMVQSVAGGGHWGGGMIINALDMARFGLLTLHHGNWNGRQLLSEKWVQMALTPTPVEKTYGFMNWFLNTDRKLFPSVPASVFCHIGNGTNAICVDPEMDLVTVVRWINRDALDGFLARARAAVKDTQLTSAK